VNIVQAFAMFGARMKAIELCVNRFDLETRTAFIELYKKMEEEPVVPPTPPAQVVQVDDGQDDIPF
jgi:hypothetical protein